MHTALDRIAATASLLLLASGFRAAAAQSEGITVTDFSDTHTGGVFYAFGTTGALRRNTTSTIVVVKNLVDLVPDNQIGFAGGGTLVGSISHGRTNQGTGTGFISVKVSVPLGQTLGSTITLNVGLLDHFKFTTIHEDLITNISAPNPDPKTVQGGAAFTLAFAGTDLNEQAEVLLSGVTCHTVTNGTRNSTQLVYTLQRTASCTSLGPFSGQIHASEAGSLRTFTKSDGTSGFTFGPYVAPPPVGLECVSIPNLQAPTIRQPATGGTLTFFPASGSPQKVTIAWDAQIQRQAAPQNTFLVTLPNTPNARGGTVEVVGTSISPSLPVPGTYTVTVRAKNCGTPSGTASVTFTLRFQ